MITLFDKLKTIYPDIINRSDVVIHDDGNGQYIHKWAYTQPQPTQDQLDTLTLPLLKTSKESELRAARENHEKKGFVSTALGTAHTYLSNELDQKVNVIAAGLHTAIGREFVCLDQNDVDDLVYHNTVQMQKVLDDGDTFVQGSYVRLYTLLNQVRAIDINVTYPTLADAEAAIAAIVWTDTW